MLQIIPVDRANPAVTAEIQVPSEIKTILSESCYDCHSSQTRWPWYSFVAPVSWLIAGDVAEGRRHLNFSEWGTLSSRDKAALKLEIGHEIKAGDMPLPIYTLLHRDAKLSEHEIQVLKRWLDNKSESVTE